jgi:uncharacterized glyoxalase superfamily metalloenzyme YdcJ
MVSKELRGATDLIDKARKAVEKVAEALDTALNGPRPAPVFVPVRQPSPEAIRRQRRSRSGY